MADDDRFYVKTLRMQNFRCFEDVELGPFDPHFNLLVGENGAGKSSVLVALAELFREVAGLGAGANRLTRHSDTRLENVENADFIISTTRMPYFVIGASGCYNGEAISSHEIMFSDTNDIGGPARTKSDDYSTYVPPNRNNEGKILDIVSPIIALYSTQRSFAPGIGAPDEPQQRGRIRDAAFRFWYDAGLAVKEMREWFERETLASLQSLQRERQTGAKEFRVLPLVHSALTNLIEEVSRVEFDADIDDLIVQFIDGRRSSFAEMSDGQRAYIGLVVDLSRRIALLNAPFLGPRALSETPGLVLIDEIDLHLHPRWQRQIVPALKKVFPKIQFFATTHSPQVIGECKPEEIVLLTPQGQKRPGPSGSYGRDSNWVLECVMGAEGRDPEVAKQLKAIWDAIEKGYLQKARGLIKKLRKSIGDDPDIIGAESYMWRIEHVGEEAAE